MLLAEEPTLAGWSWTIMATDLDEEALPFGFLPRSSYSAKSLDRLQPPEPHRNLLKHGAKPPATLRFRCLQRNTSSYTAN
jgi:hypothetical protein